MLAIHDGESAEKAQESFREHGLKLQLVTDPQRRISRLYGVSCWPTTVGIDPDGSLGGVHLGATPGDHAFVEKKAAEPEAEAPARRRRRPRTSS